MKWTWPLLSHPPSGIFVDEEYYPGIHSVPSYVRRLWRYPLSPLGGVGRGYFYINTVMKWRNEFNLILHGKSKGKHLINIDTIKPNKSFVNKYKLMLLDDNLDIRIRNATWESTRF